MNEIRIFQQNLVDHLMVEYCITTPLIEQAFLDVPRHLFLPGEPLEQVYTNQSIVLRRDFEGELTSSSSQPAIMAIMLEQLDLKPGQRVLEIGTGSGFNAALIASIVGPEGQVVTMDIQPDLIEHARKCLDCAGYAWVRAVVGDGGYGYPDGAPYDRIILTVASPVITSAWREQLAPGGKLVVPLMVPGGQKSVAFQRQDQELVSHSVKECGFILLQGDFAPPTGTRFQIGSNPNLQLHFGGGDELPIKADRFAGWLSEPGQDWATGVTTTMNEIGSSFFPWLAQQKPSGEQRSDLRASLIARGDLADQDAIPALYGFDEPVKAMHTFVLIEVDGAAAMMRPPGQSPPLIDVNHPPDGLPPSFELYVRQLGPGTHAVQSLVKSIQDWDQAGRPESKWHLPSFMWQIRALHAEMPYTPAEDEFLLDQKWTKLVIRFQ